MGVEFVAYRAEHAAAVAELQTHLWSGDLARNAAYFQWKYLENPFLDHPAVYLAMDGSRAVAMRGAFGSAWEANNSPQPFLIPCVDDMVIDPAYRNRGLMRPLMDTLFEDLVARGFQFLFSLSAAPVTLVVSLATGWRTVGSTDPIARVSRAAATAQRIRALAERSPLTHRLAGHVVLASEREPFRHLDRSRRRERRITLVKEPRPAEMAALVKRIGGDGRIRHVRDERYFEWRFRNPLADYRYLFWDEQTLGGYLVLRRNASDRGDRVCTCIVEWEATNEKIRLALLDEALRRGAFARLETWGATLSDPLRAELHRRRFRAVDAASIAHADHRILVRCLDPSLTDWRLNGKRLLEMNQWDLRLVHSMAG